MKFSEFTSEQHRAQAGKWRTRIWTVFTVSYLAIILLMINHIVTKNEHWVALPAMIFWIGAVLIALMFIPLVRHNRKDDKFD